MEAVAADRQIVCVCKKEKRDAVIFVLPALKGTLRRKPTACTATYPTSTAIAAAASSKAISNFLKRPILGQIPEGLERFECIQGYYYEPDGL